MQTQPSRRAQGIPSVPTFTVTIDRTPLRAGNLKAFASVSIPTPAGEPLTIHKWRIVQESGKQKYVAPPQEKWTDDTGTMRYAPLLAIPKAWRVPIEQAILAAWNEHLRTQEGAN